MRRRGRAVVWLVWLAVISWAVAAQGAPKLLKAFTSTYPEVKGSQLAKCQTCHQAKVPKLNAYGDSLKLAMGNFAAVDSLDSDGDGFLNINEIQALTLPGDPESRPKTAQRDSASAAPDSAAAAEEASE